jgi:hypothetical protein
MPIRAERKHLYPKDWRTISQRIRFERAKGRCEFAGCSAVHGEPHPITGSNVVLTVAHLNHDETDCSDENLLAGCQRCHLTYDAKHHAKNARATLRKRKAIGDLFT